MKNILVPTNFSENCNKAAQLGMKMAMLFNSEIHFIHLMRTPVGWIKMDKLKEKKYPDTLKQIGIAKAALQGLKKLAEREGLKCHTFLQYDARHTYILKHSGNFHHDFIITGSSGTKGVIREITGSNVEEIVRKANAPVIVVKDEEVRFPFKNIVFVSDFMEDASEAFKKVIPIASKCNAKIHLLRINTKSDNNSIAMGLQPIKQFLEKFPEFQNYSMNIYNEMNVESGINTYLENNPADLIAMCTHGTTGFLSLFSKSIAEGVTNHSNLPVLTIHI